MTNKIKKIYTLADILQMKSDFYNSNAAGICVYGIMYYIIILLL